MTWWADKRGGPTACMWVQFILEFLKLTPNKNVTCKPTRKFLIRATYTKYFQESFSTYVLRGSLIYGYGINDASVNPRTRSFLICGGFSRFLSSSNGESWSPNHQIKTRLMGALTKYWELWGFVGEGVVTDRGHQNKSTANLLCLFVSISTSDI